MNNSSIQYIKLKRNFSIILCLFLVTFACLYILSRRQTEFQYIEPTNGIIDIQNINVSKHILNIGNNWDFFPEHLYNPNNTLNKTPLNSISAKNINYGTYKLIIKALPNTYYSLCSYSIDYATKVYVNGKEQLNIGIVSNNKKDFSPRIDYIILPLYSDENGKIEIIYQYSNFMHNQGGSIQPTYLSSPENINHFNQGNDLSSLFFGSSLLIFAFYFLLNSATQLNMQYFFLAICCLLMALRDQNFLNNHIIPLWINWVLVYRMYILIISLLPPSILLLFNSIYSDISKKNITIIYVFVIIIHSILHFTLDTHNLVALCTSSYFIALPYLIYVIINIIRHYIKVKHYDTSDVFTLSAITVLLISLIVDGLLAPKISIITRYGIAPYGMLIFVLLTSLSISLKIQKRELALTESKRKTEMLEKINQMNKSFLHNVAHELKTPLTVMSGYAQLTRMQLKSNKTNSETCDNLMIIQKEAIRLGDIVTKLMDYSYGKQTESDFKRIDVKELISNAISVCKPMCEKNCNSITTNTLKDLYVHGNFDILLQVLINLIINANKHTNKGSIIINADNSKEKNSYIKFTVSDTGSGIEQKYLTRIFEKGFSTDGSSGLGLAICKDAIDQHNGKIGIEKSDYKGTVFFFSVPGEE